MTISKIVTDSSIQEKKKRAVSGMLPHKRLLVSLKLRIIGYAKAFESDGLEYFLFNCSKHGKVIAYPQGHDSFLACPNCDLSSIDSVQELGADFFPVREAGVQ